MLESGILDPRGAGLFRSGSTCRYSFRDQISKLDYQLSWCLDQRPLCGATAGVKWRVFSVRKRSAELFTAAHRIGASLGCIMASKAQPRQGSDRARSPAAGAPSARRSWARRAVAFCVGYVPPHRGPDGKQQAETGRPRPAATRRCWRRSRIRASDQYVCINKDPTHVGGSLSPDLFVFLLSPAAGRPRLTPSSSMTAVNSSDSFGKSSSSGQNCQIVDLHQGQDVSVFHSQVSPNRLWECNLPAVSQSEQPV